VRSTWPAARASYASAARRWRCGRDAVDVLVADDPDLVVANDNAPGQVVVAGTPPALRRLRDRVRAAGGRLVPLDVEGAFHSPAMQPAVPPLRAALDAARWQPVTVPLLTATSVQLLETSDAIAESLAAGVLAPVRWLDVQRRLVGLGVTDLVEVGPGGVLAGLAKRSAPELRVHTVAGPADVPAVADRFASTVVGAGR
jgi:[acyl-carrier-protein] S-malonyltransferase